MDVQAQRRPILPGARLTRCPLCPDSDQILQRSEMSRWAMYGRRPQCKRNLTFCEAFGCSHVSGLFSHEGVTSIAMQPLWPLALM
jgi:hypothetical protein